MIAITAAMATATIKLTTTPVSHRNGYVHTYSVTTTVNFGCYIHCATDLARIYVQISMLLAKMTPTAGGKDF